MRLSLPILQGWDDFVIWVNGFFLEIKYQKAFPPVIKHASHVWLPYDYNPSSLVLSHPSVSSSSVRVLLLLLRFQPWHLAAQMETRQLLSCVPDFSGRKWGFTNWQGFFIQQNHAFCSTIKKKKEYNKTSSMASTVLVPQKYLVFILVFDLQPILAWNFWTLWSPWTCPFKHVLESHENLMIRWQRT